MAAICNKSGFVLIASLVIMALLLLLSVYLINFTLAEYKIANSQVKATQTYYLAESGIAEAIYKLKNDPTWQTNFETNPNWSTTYTRNPAIYPNGYYQIDITNTGLASAEINVTAWLETNGNTTKRQVKAYVYKSLGANPVGDNAEFSDGDIDISGSVYNVYGGSVFSIGDVIVDFFSTLNVDNAVRATGEVDEHWTSTINAATIEEGVEPISMPAVSFDNLDDPESYINRADQIYTESQFEDLLWDNRDGLTLNGITYVTGDIDIKGPIDLTVNGVLVAEDDIEVGKNTFFCCWGIRCGQSDIIINSQSSTTPSGLLAKGKIDFELCLDDFEVEGLVYAADQINVLSLPGTFEVLGGIISRQLNIISIWQGLNLIFDSNLVAQTLGNPTYSPIVIVDHWEEEY